MKNKKTLIIIICTILAILAAILALNLIPETQNEPPKTETTQKPRINIFTADKEVLSITFNSGEPFKLVKNNNLWMVFGKEYTDLDQNAVASAISTLTDLYASRVLDIEGELSDYGIDTAKATATLEFSDSATKSFYVGSLLPDESGYYLFAEGLDSVYVISKLSAKNITSELIDLRNLTVTEADTESITSFSVTGENGLISMKYNHNDMESDVYGVLSNWKMSHPESYDADNEAVVNLMLTPMCSIAAIDVAADLKEGSKKYRLPYSFEFTNDGQTYSFSAGFDKEFGYILSHQKGITYKVNPESLSFLKVSFFDVAEKFLSIIDLNNLASATVYADGKTALLSTEGTDDNQKYFIDGKEYTLDKFRPYYMALISAEADGQVSPSYSKKGEMLASIKFELKDSKTEYFEFYDYDELNCAVFKNGKCLFYMRRTLLDHMLMVLE